MTRYRPVHRMGTAALACAGAMGFGASLLRAQQAQAPPQPQLIGYVKADDADVTGATSVLDGQAVLAGAVGVTAKDHTAIITLGRGGLARVCQTSALHMTESRAEAGSSAAPLLFSLDRGAIEIRMNGLAEDAIMTPDLRMTVRTNGPLDVRLRVARNGDTCVENRGTSAPTLAVSDPFGGSNYELMAGQHVLFEHGDLHEVVDHEPTPCGCPDERGASVADALLATKDAPAGVRSSTPSTQQAHPFPEAVSEGLAPAAEVAPASPNAVQPQVTAELRYNAAADGKEPEQAAVQAGQGTAAADSAPQSASAETVESAAAAAPELRRRGGRQPAVKAFPGEGEPTGPGSEVRQGMQGQPGGAAAAKKGQAAKSGGDASPNRDVVHAIGHFFHLLFGH
ncbi:MAG TPA: hypothetical protein VG714_06425 [Acidobacteriaceae bacterium]|nr:hypothetical protein [Acidobacteriaceae bacterium]